MLVMELTVVLLIAERNKILLSVTDQILLNFEIAIHYLDKRKLHGKFTRYHFFGNLNSSVRFLNKPFE